MDIGLISLGAGFMLGAVMTDVETKDRLIATIVGLLFVLGGLI